MLLLKRKHVRNGKRIHYSSAYMSSMKNEKEADYSTPKRTAVNVYQIRVTV